MKRLKKIADRFKSGDRTTGGRINMALLAAQRKAADYLNHKTAGWSQRKTKVVFVIFFLVTGSTSLFITGRAILSANGPPKSLKVQRLHVPAPKQLQTQDSVRKMYP